MNKSMTEKEAIEALMTQTSNELLQTRISNRLMKRQDFKNDLNAQQKQAMGQMQNREKALEKTLVDLKDFWKEAKDTSPLADLFPTE